jgi:hypothetical protein
MAPASKDGRESGNLEPRNGGLRCANPPYGLRATRWGQINAIRPLPVIDGLLAATALVRGMTFVTRDTRDVAGTGVRTVNPWTA